CRLEKNVNALPQREHSWREVSATHCGRVLVTVTVGARVANAFFGARGCEPVATLVGLLAVVCGDTSVAVLLTLVGVTDGVVGVRTVGVAVTLATFAGLMGVDVTLPDFGTTWLDVVETCCVLTGDVTVVGFGLTCVEAPTGFCVILGVEVEVRDDVGRVGA